MWQMAGDNGTYHIFNHLPGFVYLMDLLELIDGLLRDSRRIMTFGTTVLFNYFSIRK
jgi:hypothetical protein